MDKKLYDITRAISSRFVYTADHKWIDAWNIMSLDKDGVYRGDCEDFALTVIWHYCDRNIFKFVLNFFVLHRYSIWYASTSFGPHAVAKVGDFYTENLFASVLTKKELTDVGIKVRFPFILPLMPLKFVFGGLKTIWKAFKS